MKRVLVLGCAGSGKSTVSRKLAEILDLPVIHLDKYYWKPGWQGAEREPWQKTVVELASEPAWVMDGNYSTTLSQRLSRADAAVFLDLPRYQCLTRVLRRTILNYGRVRDDLPENCPERFDIDFLRYVWNFNRDNRPDFNEILRHFKGRTFYLHSSRDIHNFLNEMKTSA